MTSRRLAVVLAVCLAGGGVFWWSSSGALGRRSAHDQQQSARFVSSQRAIKELAIPRHVDPAALTSGLAPLLDDPALNGVPATIRTRLSEDVAEFVQSRYGQSAADYIRWRRERNYREVPLPELRRRWFVDQTYEHVFGKPLPPQADWDELHTALIEGLDAADGGRHRLAGLATATNAMAVSVKKITPADPRWPALGGLVGGLLDDGNVIYTSIPWWSPPHTERDLLRRQGEAWVANVGFVGQFADGARRPVSISMLWDPVAGRWSVISMHFGTTERNVDGEGPRVEF